MFTTIFILNFLFQTWRETYSFFRLCAPDNANVSEQAGSGTKAENSLQTLLDVNMTEAENSLHPVLDVNMTEAENSLHPMLDVNKTEIKSIK